VIEDPVDYAERVEAAPPGWRHFTISDITRLPASVRAHEMAHIPDGEPDENVLRAMFWTLVYHLEPERWDELATHEPIPDELIDALPRAAPTGVDVGAGSGRLTLHLARRCEQVVAVEPSAGLRLILQRRMPGVQAIGAWADALPIEDRWSALTAACGVLGPEPQILHELERITASGGVIALISPEHPELFEVMGWTRITALRTPPPPHPRWIDDFFGPPDPPHEMVTLRVS
jgi:SAM-dependent methyltransferase